jgi:hypothetical protein
MGLVKGLVSGTKNQRIKTTTRATDAMLRNTAAPPKLAAMRSAQASASSARLKIAVLKEVPIPDAVPIKDLALDGSCKPLRISAYQPSGLSHSCTGRPS